MKLNMTHWQLKLISELPADGRYATVDSAHVIPGADAWYEGKQVFERNRAGQYRLTNLGLWLQRVLKSKDAA